MYTMTTEDSIAVLREHQSYHESFQKGSENKIIYHRQISEALSIVLCELEKVSTKLGESLPNGGFCVPNCNNSMKPTIENDKV